MKGKENKKKDSEKEMKGKENEKKDKPIIHHHSERKNSSGTESGYTYFSEKKKNVYHNSSRTES